MLVLHGGLYVNMNMRMCKMTRECFYDAHAWLELNPICLVWDIMRGCGQARYGCLDLGLLPCKKT